MNQPIEQIEVDEEPAEGVNTPKLATMLRAKYDRQQYALLFDVPDTVSLAQKRRIDAISFGLWASAGQEIQGFELKVSRSDWLRELKQVDKADPFIALCDRFWLVTADNKIAKLEEIPACWGWMSATKSGLRVQRPAQRLPGIGESVPRGFVLGIMRKLQDDMLNSPDVLAVIEDRIKNHTSRIDERIKWETRDLIRQRDEALKVVKDFEENSGIRLMDWRYGNVAELVKSLNGISSYGVSPLEKIPQIFEQHENVLKITLEQVRKVRAELASLEAQRATVS